ncbi:MAG: DUF2079 domain-containing protein [Actinobacteria bacterium]|nr:DUF2079 domain-containing protein [Actinomycetota bacterium]
MAATVGFTVVSAVKFASFRYGFDTAVVLNVLWRLAHGYDSVTALTGFAHLSDHPSLLLLTLVPLTRLAGPWIPQLLFALQALSTAMVAWSVWRLARARGLDMGVSVSLYLVTLLGAGSWFAATGEFHIVDLALGPLAAVAANHALDRPGRAVFWAAVAASARIEIAVVIIIMGLVILREKRRSGFSLMGVGAVVGTVLMVIGSLSNGGGVSFAAHLGHLGSSPIEALGTIARHPFELFRPLGNPIMLIALFFWLASFAALPVVLGGRWLLPALPMLAIPMLGTWTPADWYFEHYWHVLLVFGAVAAVEGLLRLRASPKTLSLLLVGSSLVVWVAFGPLSPHMPVGWRLDLARPDPAATEVALHVPPSESLSVPLNLAPSFALRRSITFFPRPFSCEGTESLLPGLLAPGAEPPETVVATDGWPPQDDGVWAALRNHYRLGFTVGEYGVWQLQDRVGASTLAVDCYSGEPEP